MDVDSNGWPTLTACMDIASTVSDAVTLSTVQQNELADILQSVILEFCSPAPMGTGRVFVGAVSTEVFDGNGYPELRIPEIVPGGLQSVTAYGSLLPDVLLKSGYRELPYEIITRQYAATLTGGYAYNPGVFPLGHQNITVTAMWGYSQTVPFNIAKAVATECAARILVAAVAGTRGVKQMSKIGDVTSGQGTHPDVALATSFITVSHAQYLATIVNYRDDGLWRASQLFRRMS